MHETINGLVASYGYALLVVLVGLESFGIPLPGETGLVTAGAFAAMGRLTIAGVIVAAAAGAILGDNAGYWLGRKGGIALVHRYGRHVGLDDAKLERVHGFFDRHGPKTVFIGRFVALLRVTAAWMAGMSHMEWRKFLIWNAAGGIVWAIGVALIAYYAGQAVAEAINRYGLYAVLGLIAIAIIGFFALRYWNRRFERGLER